ncbi:MULTISPECIES: endospore germination permease [unclassified Bacillus (in: firmicutes)]|uniref:GerAB/ArcD/ProY family transporter n=1 Tax=unclassified Bacillus (in: firmicutes) TaxID=185979 RepID=UPI0028896B5E|nr:MULTISPECIES: endospore germination permease [unclassified Bacillus (in: firmicutes)]
MNIILENGKISSSQFTILVTFFIIGGSILYGPTSLVHGARQDAWIANILVLGMGLLLVLLYNELGSCFPNMTITEYSEKILGKWLGKVVSLLYFTYFFLSTANFVRQAGDFTTTQFMPDTPITSIHILFFLIVIMGVRIGIEPFSRASEVFFPLVVMLVLIFIISLSNQIEFQHIQPVLGEGMKPVIRVAFHSLGTPYLQLVLLLMLFPYVNQTKEAKKSFLFGTLIGGIVLILVTSLSILVLGTETTERHQFVSYVLARKINVGDFFQRIEAVMAIIWFITMYFKITIYFYASILSLSQVFKLKNHRFLTYPLGMITIVLSLVINENIVESNKQAEFWTSYSLPFGLFFPLLMLIVSKIKKINAKGTG